MVYALRHQRMRGVEQPLYLGFAIALLAVRDIIFGVSEVIQNTAGVRPLTELIIVLEKVIVPERRVSNHQSLHRGGVLLHDVAYARVGVDHYFIGEALQSHAVDALVLRKSLAEGPVPIEQRHSGRRIGVKHLLGRDDFDLIWENIQAKLFVRDAGDRFVNSLDRLEIPIIAIEKKGAGVHRAVSPALTPRRWNNCRNTG